MQSMFGPSTVFENPYLFTLARVNRGTLLVTSDAELIEGGGLVCIKTLVFLYW